MSDLPLPEPAPEQVFDIQHDTDPAREEHPARHIPHLGHALLFFALAWLFVCACLILFVRATHAHTDDLSHDHPGFLLLGQGVAYALTLGTSYLLFPRLWRWSFLQGLQWNARAAQRRWYWLVLGGFVLSGTAQLALHFFPPLKDSPMEQLMSTPLAAWFTMAFGTLLAPMMEEVAFRGFLLPALATAYDWLMLERTPAALQRWQSTVGHSVAALAFSAIFSSVPFALLHAGQLSHAWGAVSILYGVSLVLSLVRIRTRSVACSTLVHAAYNFSIFAAVAFATGGFRHLDKLH